jgi:PPOX class probable F420-dependent enzyme
MDMNSALTWAAGRTDAVLITIRSDGRPQSSDISYAYAPKVDDIGTFDISLTDGRAKTKNMRRDNRVVLHLTDRSSWSYLSFDGTVELTNVTTEPGDAVGDALVDYYERVAGEPHPDWDEYRAAMISEGRLLVRFTPVSVVGQIR